MTDEAVEALAECIAERDGIQAVFYQKFRVVYMEQARKELTSLAALGWELRKKEGGG